MAPLGLLQRLREYWPYGKVKDTPPPLSTPFAVSISILFTLIYVIPFYFSSATRPSTTVSRDSSTVIKARVRSVLLSCLICAIATVYILSALAHLPWWQTLRLLGWYPISLPAIGKGLFLTATLFLGPLFENFVVEEGWREFPFFRSVLRELNTWTGWRNYVAGPFTEELLFRSLLISINLLSPQVRISGEHGNHAKNVILSTPLYFGIAHVHHLYEFRITHPSVPWSFALARTAMQLTYTTIFGWFAAFLFVRTGSLPAAILVHTFCNFMGLPRLWGRVERPQAAATAHHAGTAASSEGSSAGETRTPGFRPRSGSYVRSREHAHGDVGTFIQRRSIDIWTACYYVLLFAGVYGFWKGLFPLTETSHRLAEI